MSWSERLKVTFKTFKNVAIPLYLWTLIFLVLVVIFSIIATIPFFIVFFILFQGEPFSNGLTLDTGVTHLSSSAFPFDHSILPYSILQNTNFLIFFVLFIFGIMLLGLIAGSIFNTGMINLTRKGLSAKASFKDFSAKGAVRVIKWNIVILFSSILLSLCGLILLFVLGDMSIAFKILFVLYFIAFGLLAIFLYPWVICGAIYVQVRNDLSFDRAFKASWQFYRKNMPPLWGLVLLYVIFSALFLALQYYLNEPLQVIASLLFSPFLSLMPIVWTLTLMQEKEDFVINPELTDPVYAPEPVSEPFSPNTVSSTDLEAPSGQENPTEINKENKDT